MKKANLNTRKSVRFLLLSWGLLICGAAMVFGQSPERRVLVFSKTAAFRHASIEAGKAAFQKMAQEKGFTVDLTEDATQFNPENLKRYRSVVFLNTTGDVLNTNQQTDFEHYIQAGGGYLGIHAATDTEYDWPWYGRLAGAYFLDHPSVPSNVQKGKFIVAMKNHWATKGMPDEFERTDEFYAFKNISPSINVLLKIDEKTYQGGKNGDNHPMSWYQEFDGGRAFYTAMGHTDETFSEPLFLNHIWAGLNYVMGGDAPKALDYTKARPDENRFTKVVLEEKLDEPMELSVLGDGRILFIQRKGEIRLYNTKTKQLKTIAKLDVNTKYTSKEGKVSEGEDGVLGLNKDPNFAQNHWIYLYYSPAGGEPKNILTRYELRGDELVMSSKKVILEVATQREECCHTGGSIAWDKAGNLYLSTGDNTNPHGSNGFSPSDERPGRESWDAQKSSANTNDLRGKIIRIKPQPDGSYTIPEGNLFPKGTPQTRPEIYTMGHRNPFRISVDQKTGFVYWGEVGPDANKPADDRGPAGHDEVGQARKAGNFGWPHFVGDNKAYNKFDFVNNKSGERWDATKPLNTSPNNTGLKELPPAQKAFIWYPYGESPEFPMVGSGGRNAMAGPVFYSEEFKNAARSFPKYYDGKILTYDWMRGWIMAVTMDKDGNYVSMDRFMPSYKFSNPMDMEFDANGDLYMLEYGSGWFTANDDARLIRIEYNGGNRKPMVQVAADKLGGSVPFKVNLSSKGTTDADGDALKYSWKITSKDGFNKVVNEANPTLALAKAGVYKATLTVTDAQGASNAQSLELTAGNEPPVLTFDLPKSNKTFFFANKSFDYEVKVSDKEDGSLANGKIKPEQVAVSIDYLAEGYDKIAIAQGHRSADASAGFATGKKLIAASDCQACHSIDKKSIGPMYSAIAQKYKGDASAIEKLAKKVISGGSGVWGETPMAGHPQLSAADAGDMVKYILSLSNEKANPKSLPVAGSYTTKIPAGDKGQGVFILRASYEDQGNKGLPSLASEQTYTLRNAKISPHGFDKYESVNKMSFGGNDLVIPSKSGAYVGLNQADLTGIQRIELIVATPKAQLNAQGGNIELRLGSPTGKLIGESGFIEATDKGGFGGNAAKINLTPTEGIHDVYLVFQNPKAEGSLMVVMGIEFKTDTPALGNVPAVDAAPKNDISAYAGKYKMTGLPFEYIEVKVKDGKVIMDAGGQGGEISSTGTPDKFDADGKGTVYFVRDESANVSKIKLEAMGMVFEGKKE
ncbi:ThuA domain-containing protein [Runella aurantiaca]|uniref:Cytochrome C n=1 Tax=Runella aurantiaca TaxID=2282308 RepID=A0A369I5U9_9BACT|nr:ThuA domain-containing protein [Runella aurantiaca]RDB03857.1 cytochrome C [Runella aurantiaca]